jgi:hypothetical protein
MRRTGRNLIGTMLALLLAAAPIAAAAQQWDGRNNTTDPIWRTGKVALGFKPGGPTEAEGLLELNRPLEANRALLLQAGATFRDQIMTVLEVDTGRSYFGGARRREAQVPSSGIDVAVNTGAVVGLAYFPGSAPAGYRLAVGGSIRAEGAVFGDLSVGRAVGSDYAVRVVGKMLAEEVRVEPLSGWPDHVFAPEYELASLGEVERFARHLPGMPTAEKVAAAGVSLGEMQAKLLLKVEELTLHLIEQQKTIAALQARLEAVERGAGK